MRDLRRTKITVVGLGYVGLPLAVEFGKKYSTIGFDIDSARIRELRLGRDSTLESSADELAAAKKLTFTADPRNCRAAGIYRHRSDADHRRASDLSPRSAPTDHRRLRGAIIIQ